MGYKEEIFKRLEKKGYTNVSQIKRWLAGKDTPGYTRIRPESSFSNFAAQLAEPFGLREEIEKTDDFEELKRLEQEAENIPIYDSKTVEMARKKKEAISKELVKLTEERKEKRLGEEKKLFNDYSNKISSSKTIDEIDNILSDAKDKFSSPDYNKLERVAGREKKDLRQQAHKELMEKQAKEKEKRKERDRLEREAEKQKKTEEREKRRQESIRKQREVEERKERDRLAKEVE